MKEIPDGDFYDCESNPEGLTHESAEDAIEAFFDSMMRPSSDPRAVIAESCPLELVVYRRIKADEKWIERETGRLLDVVVEDMDEEFGDPDGYHDLFEAVGLSVVKNTLRSAVATAASEASVWSCEEAGKVMLDAAEVEAMLRVQRPEWFEVAP